MESGLRNKVVLVTGASGGIGSATARAFAAEGARLVLQYHRGRTRAQALARECASVETLIAGADLRREAAVRQLFARAVRRFGRVDVLVANAGAWEARDRGLHEMTLRQWNDTLGCVLTSAFLCLREFLRQVERQRQGNAILVASTAGVFGEAGHADYAAAKAGMAFGLTRTAKNEIARLAPTTSDYCGGRVNCVCPGWTAVPRNIAKLANPNVVGRVTATMALRKVARPADIANAIVYFASDRLSGHLTGQSLVVAGGMEGRLLWSPEAPVAGAAVP